MTISLNRPTGLEDLIWAAIEQQLDRLQRADRDNDLPLVIGSAKDLVETIAKIVLDAKGQTVASNADLPAVLTSAHTALDRLPGQGSAAATLIRNIAQGAKSIVAQLPELRNKFGTGHGRVFTPEVDEEVVSVCLDAAVLWSRWALRRLGHLLIGTPKDLVRALHEDIFYRDTLRDRLQAVNLPSLDPSDQRLIGVAVAHRAMRDTFMVRIEGVDACAQQPDLSVWPPDYRAGLVEGLFLDREGYIDVATWGVTAAAMVLAPHPTATEILQELAAKLGQAQRAPRLVADMFEPSRIAATMQTAEPILSSDAARHPWRLISRFIQPPPTILH